MYPRNAASPPRIAIGPVVQISDGAVQTSGVSVKVLPEGGTASAGGGTVAYEEGVVHYVPTQAETNYTAFMVIAYKTGCIPAAVSVVTTATATAGTVDVGAISGDSTAADNLEAACDGGTYNVGGGAVVAASVTAAVTAGTVSDKTGYALTSAYDAAKTAGTSTLTAQQVWEYATRALTDKAGFSLSGTITTLDALNTSLSSTHGAGSWATATGFSTHSAADVVTALGTGTTLTALATAANQTTIIGYVDCLPATWVIPAAAGDAMALTSGERTSVADAVLGRSVATIEGTAAEWSLCTVILATLESSVSGTTWTIKRTDGTTTHATKTITTDSAADPITGVS